MKITPRADACNPKNTNIGNFRRRTKYISPSQELINNLLDQTPEQLTMTLIKYPDHPCRIDMIKKILNSSDALSLVIFLNLQAPLKPLINAIKNDYES